MMKSPHSCQIRIVALPFIRKQRPISKMTLLLLLSHERLHFLPEHPEFQIGSVIPGVKVATECFRFVAIDTVYGRAVPMSGKHVNHSDREPTRNVACKLQQENDE